MMMIPALFPAFPPHKSPGSPRRAWYSRQYLISMPSVISMKSIKSIKLTGICALALATYAPSSLADVVTDWNQLLLDALRAENAAPTGGSRTAAMVHAAIYDAINSVLRTHEPYRFSLPGAPGALPEAAGLAAAYHTLTVLCPSKRALFDAKYASTFAALPSGPGRDEGLRIGHEVATRMLEWRGDDGSTTDVPYIPSDAPGAWRRTAPDFRPPLAPNWGFVKPFAVPSTDSFPVPPPPRLDDVAYAHAFDEVKAMGARTGHTRTIDQTEIGIFWAYDRGGMGPPPILYNQLVQVIAQQQGNSLVENARLFALINLAQVDAGIVCWAAKYQYNFWRPITAIQTASSDGNPDTNADPAWEPLGAPGAGVRPDFTPPFPSYPSGHATFGGAVCRMLERFYGRDDISYPCTSDELSGVVRHYRSFSQADEENALSRVYLGVHWMFDQRVGQASGWAIADYVFHNLLRPIPTSPELSVPLRLPDGSYAIHLATPFGKRFSIKASENLGTWSLLTTAPGPFTFIDPPNARATRFYLAVEGDVSSSEATQGIPKRGAAARTLKSFFQGPSASGAHYCDLRGSSEGLIYSIFQGPIP
jgi:hypothetical protein